MVAPASIPQNTRRAAITSVSAPIGGWNARDSLAEMQPLDAVTLDNWWPGTSSVILRNGYTEHATGLPDQVETLMAYSSATSEKLFAVSAGGIYDVTSAGAVGSAAVSSLSNSRFQYANFTTTGGSYLVCINGADKQQIYDGSSWHKDGDGSPYNISNLDTSKANSVVVFKHYLFYTAGTLKAWYLPINAIGGAATGLDMSSLATRGGYLIAGMTWTLDAGYGIDDYLVFITSRGEAFVWQLTDPTTPSGIALIGVYYFGSPIGQRPWIKYAGDLLILTQDGIVPLSAGLQSSRLDPRVSITNKIQFAISSSEQLYGSNFGWQMLTVPKYNQLYLNVPVMEGSQQIQYVQNNITAAWCSFSGWAANCWELFQDEPYFGGNTVVNMAWQGHDDNGASIQAFAIQAFQSFGDASEKQAKMIRYHFLTDGSPTLYGNVNVNYDLSDNSAELNSLNPGFGVWDTAVWDTDIWGAGLGPSADWDTATGVGYVFAPTLKTATNGIQVQWLSTDLVLEPGGAL